MGSGAAAELAALRNGMKTVLFACTHNAGLSQIAAALFNQLADPSLARAISGGPHPRRRVHPPVVEAMREVGIDLSTAKPRYSSYEMAEGAYILVTMGCGDECPFVPGLRRVDWWIDDPKDQPLEIVCRIRDAVADRVRRLLEEEGWNRGRAA